MRSHLIVAGVVILLLSGCTSATAEPEESRPTPAGAAYTYTPRPTPTVEPVTYVTKYEFLGQGSANIVYMREGTNLIQETVALPYEVVLYSGPVMTGADSYLSAGAAYTQDGDVVGCRITRDNQIIDEILPTPGSISALCDSN